jgi:hypothetical protein
MYFDRYRTGAIYYLGGLRYPHLERIMGTPDRLSDIFAARKSRGARPCWSGFSRDRARHSL